jgi:CubicO group peptidase (beta-lactamase class C family)
VSVETEILGLVLRAAIGKPIADYLHDRIWQTIGTRHIMGHRFATKTRVKTPGEC